MNTPESLSTPSPSGNSPVLIGLVVVSLLIAVGVTGYFMTQSPAAESSAGNDTETSTTTTPVDLNIFAHIRTNTSRTGTDDASTVTYLQGHQDETIYCSTFDDDIDGTTAAMLADPEIAAMISSRVGSSRADALIERLTSVMNIDNGLLTEVCNYNGNIWALVLSSDYQTVTPYHFNSGLLDAYNPFITEGGYGSLYFDHITDIVVAATLYPTEQGVLHWEYYALDPESGATDLIERCARDARTSEVSLVCSREYMP